MLINFLIYILPIVIIFWSKAEESQDIFLKGSADYRIEYTVGDDDIEMVRKDELIPFKISDTVNKFNELNKMCRKEYYKKIRSKSLIHRYHKDLDQSDLELGNKRWRLSRRYKKGSSFSASRHLQHRRQLDLYDEPEYNYEALADEYIAQAEREEKSNETYHPPNIDPKPTRIMKLFKRMFTLNTKSDEQANQRQSRNVLVGRIWEIAQIWLLIYIIVAIPLWCTLGWCCCCLCCKSLKAREIIDEARKYMVWNPPGILRSNSGDIVYEPSNKEIETYEQLEHVIKTL